MAHDPCASDLDYTIVTGSGRTRTVSASPTTRPKIDCFYVYPTVSTQPTPNANLDLDPQETAVAVAQAARFSQVCNVYAPLYRQITLAVLAGAAHVTAADEALAYSDVLNAWKTYLADDNNGRGFAVIGHSQGAGILIKLLQDEVDDDPGVRARLVSAIILGGNVTVPVDRTVGGSFRHIPACTERRRAGMCDRLLHLRSAAAVEQHLRPDYPFLRPAGPLREPGCLPRRRGRGHHRLGHRRPGVVNDPHVIVEPPPNLSRGRGRSCPSSPLLSPSTPARPPRPSRPRGRSSPRRGSPTRACIPPAARPTAMPRGCRSTPTGGPATPGRW